jgi:hypothetical protein
MLTARRAFQGEEVGDILVSVLAREPDFAALPLNVSPQISQAAFPVPGERPK